MREQVALREKQLQETPHVAEAQDSGRLHELAAKETVKNYAAEPMDRQLEKGHRMMHQEVIQAAEQIKGSSASQVAELLSLVETRGLRNALAVLEKTDDPYLEDDFHRIVVQRYFSHQMGTSKLTKEETQTLGTALFEIQLPPASDQQKSLKEIVSVMEQFYSGLQSISDGDGGDTYTLEISNPHGSTEVIFYVAVPRSRAPLFEKMLLSVQPNAHIAEVPNDYNIFQPKGAVKAAYGVASTYAMLPIKTYERFDYDPLTLILNAFSKIEQEGEGASLQIIVKPVGKQYHKLYEEAIKELKKGATKSYAGSLPDTTGGKAWSLLKEAIFVPKHVKEVGEKKEEDSKDKAKEKELKNEKNAELIEYVGQKIDTPIVLTNIRILTAAHNQNRADEIFSDIVSTFAQFEETKAGGITFKEVKGSRQTVLERDFIFRSYNHDERLPLSLKELSTVFHFGSHSSGQAASPHLRSTKAATAAAPATLPQEGILLGLNTHRGGEIPVHMLREDRMRHMYVIGQTGTGKSTFIKNLAIQDIQNGDGVCFIDPHGVDVQDILAAVPKERWDDIIYFDPSHVERPMALNMLEYDRNFPEQKTFVVNEMMSIFNKLFDMKTAGGPMFEQYFRNACMLVIEDPESGNTLFDVSRVLSDKNFRSMKLSKCKNPIVVQFWREVAEKAGGESSLANMVPYITSKFDVFLSNDIMRPIVVRDKSTFNFREVMDSKKILLVNLAKGRLGDINANLIGLIIVGKFLMAALSRVDMIGKPMNDFYMYIDEFQNITTPSVATILSEARKYRLSLTVAHQFIAQLEQTTKDAVFGNVGSLVAFRVGTDDGEYLAKQFEPAFSASDLANIENRNAYIKLLINGQPSRPFNIRALPPPKTDHAALEKLKEMSYMKYGRPREEIEAEIQAAFEKKHVAPAPVPVVPAAAAAPAAPVVSEVAPPTPVAAAPAVQTPAPVQAQPVAVKAAPLPAAPRPLAQPLSPGAAKLFAVRPSTQTSV